MSTLKEVGQLALEDRAFFEALLENPRAALEEKNQEGTFDLDEEDILKVVEIIEVGLARLAAKGQPVSDLMAAWDSGPPPPDQWTPDWPTW
jgi:hypothetical protein